MLRMLSLWVQKLQEILQHFMKHTFSYLLGENEMRRLIPHLVGVDKYKATACSQLA